MSSPVVAMLWENWRLIRAEAAWRLSLSIVGGLAAFVVVAAARPNQAARDFGASVALFVVISLNFMVWVAIAKLKAGFLLAALVLRLTLEYPFPLLTVAAPIAVAHLAYNDADWSTRSKAVQWLAS